MTVRHLSEDEITERFGTREERIARYARGQRSLESIASNIEMWREQYPNRIVLIADGELVGVAEDLDHMTALLDELPMPRGEIVSWFVRVSPYPLVTSNFGTSL